MSYATHTNHVKLVLCVRRDLFYKLVREIFQEKNKATVGKKIEKFFREIFMVSIFSDKIQCRRKEKRIFLKKEKPVKSMKNQLYVRHIAIFFMKNKLKICCRMSELKKNYNP